jgi:hypothetical protein
MGCRVRKLLRSKWSTNAIGFSPFPKLSHGPLPSLSPRASSGPPSAPHGGTASTAPPTFQEE